MGRPSSAHHPLLMLTFFLSASVACATWLLTRYATLVWEEYRHWGPVLLLAWGIVLADYVEFRRCGDRYILRILRGDIHKWWAHARWWYVWKALLVAAMLYVGNGPETAKLAVVAGMGIGGALWYPHWCAVWKRMWELYEVHEPQNAAPSTALMPPPSAP